jgi:amidase
MSKCPDVIKSSDFKLRLAQHCASLTVNPNNIRNMQDLVHHTQTDPREDYPSRKTRGLQKAAMAMDDQNCQEFKDALAYMEYLANEGGVTGALQRNGLDVLVMPTCVAPIMPALGGFPMLSVPLGFYPEGTEIH